ncbi:hypothetical protein BKA70DRAFT_1569121 [Coprinopsis sp. MPI-PUGE-AT-0042]|nr:hypothetical protein BKA70DRAFT_1569121 [Coprinopsis sp. MPI-PUGE-AT-0042]
MHTVYTDPLQCLPPEVSTAIFELVIMNDYHFPSQPFDPPAVLALSQVCRSWREFAVSAPVLWRALRIHDPNPNSVREDKLVHAHTLLGIRTRASPAVTLSFVQQLSSWMEISGCLPFHLNATFSEKFPLENFIDSLFQPHHANRFQSLDLIITPTDRELAVEFPLLASNLQHQFPLLSHFNARMLERETLKSFYGHVTTHLRVCKSGLGSDSHPRGWNTVPQRLTKLHLNIVLDRMDAEMILSEASPNLVECTIETSKDPHASWSPSPSSDDSRLSFPCLKSLTMTLHDSLSQLDFLNTWEMPVLEQPKICGRELSTDDATHYYVFWEFDNEQPLKKTLLDNLAKNSALLRSVTFEKIPTLAKESILSLIQSSLSLSHLTLIHIPALARDYYQQFFDEFTLELASVLETLSIHVVVDADYSRGQLNSTN